MRSKGAWLTKIGVEEQYTQLDVHKEGDVYSVLQFEHWRKHFIETWRTSRHSGLSIEKSKMPTRPGDMPAGAIPIK